MRALLIVRPTDGAGPVEHLTSYEYDPNGAHQVRLSTQRLPASGTPLDIDNPPAPVNLHRSTVTVRQARQPADAADRTNPNQPDRLLPQGPGHVDDQRRAGNLTAVPDASRYFYWGGDDPVCVPCAAGGRP
jgi:hypothetical protein